MNRWTVSLAIGFVCLVTATGEAQVVPSRLASIIVDGYFEDWDSIAAVEDPAGDHGALPVDLRRVWLANDEHHLFIRFEFGSVQNLQCLPGKMRLFFDTDRDPGTGVKVGKIGSDLAILFPERRVYRQISGFNNGQLSLDLTSLQTAPTVSSNEFELRIDRTVIPPGFSAPIFPGPDFDMVVQTCNSGSGGGSCSSISQADFLPDQRNWLTYTFAEGDFDSSEPAVVVTKSHPLHVRLVTYNVLSSGIFADGRAERFQRVLQAIQPDIICFQEIYGDAAADTANLLNEWLPRPDGLMWQVFQGGDNILCAPWPITLTRNETTPSGNDLQAIGLVDLPDAVYASDLYILNGHYACCGCSGTDEDQARQRRADANISWLRDARTAGGNINLPQATPIIMCGDMNLVGANAPLKTLLTGDIVNEIGFGPDSPPDWDGTPMASCRTRHLGFRLAYTWSDSSTGFTPSQLDYVMYSDSSISAVSSFVFRTESLPKAVRSEYGLETDDTRVASDHSPFVVDFNVPLTSNAIISP
jgi:endonuclease/exonuclease/phosphatase family metal-dependent hydrolase